MEHVFRTPSTDYYTIISFQLRKTRQSPMCWNGLLNNHDGLQSAAVGIEQIQKVFTVMSTIMHNVTYQYYSVSVTTMSYVQ